MPASAEAVQIMEDAISTVRLEFREKNINKGEDLDSFGDFLIGPKNSIIQTTSGSYVSKQSTLNPDFAAMIVEMLIELEVDAFDKIAISYTGSYPGANIAVLSALEAMDVQAAIIASCGASEYGATYPQMNWIDIENSLFEKNIISNKSYYASIGGGLDIGTQMQKAGTKVCESSIYSNAIELLNIIDHNKNVKHRMQFYDNKFHPDDIKLFINVGGGVYSIGDSITRKEIPAGIIYPGDINSTMYATVLGKFLNQDVPIININHIYELTDWYNLPYPPYDNYKYGTGNLFYSKKQYNPKVILFAFFIVLGSVVTIGIISHREIKERMHSIEPESII